MSSAIDTNCTVSITQDPEGDNINYLGASAVHMRGAGQVEIIVIDHKLGIAVAESGVTI